MANRRETRKLTTFYKIHNKLCPPYLFNCLTPVTSDVNSYNLRNNQNYVPPRCRLRTSASSFIPSTVSLWNNLDISIRISPTLSSFKNRVKTDIYKTPKKLSILHTRLRHQCSSLNADLSKIHIINNLKCNCGASFEDAIHYFLECPLYLNERRTLLSNCDDININIETLLFRNDKNSYDVNSKLLEKFELLLINQNDFRANVSNFSLFHLYFLLFSSVKILNVYCLCFVLLSLIHVYNL